MFPAGINPNGVNIGFPLGINISGLIKLIIYCPPILTFLALNTVRLDIDKLEKINMGFDKIEHNINLEILKFTTNLDLDINQLLPLKLSIGICDHA